VVSLEVAEVWTVLDPAPIETAAVPPVALVVPALLAVPVVAELPEELEVVGVVTPAVAPAPPPFTVVTLVAPGGGGGAAPFVTPHVGVVCPACTSVGVRSPQEYAELSAVVGLTAPGTSAVTWSIPYLSKESPRLA